MDQLNLYSTPTIGMVGVIEDREKHMSLEFKQKGILFST